MSRNGNRITNYYNNIEARLDWQAQVDRAWKAGKGGLVIVLIARHKILSVETATWRKLDRATAELRAALDEAEKASQP